MQKSPARHDSWLTHVDPWPSPEPCASEPPNSIDATVSTSTALTGALHPSPALVPPPRRLERGTHFLGPRNARGLASNPQSRASARRVARNRPPSIASGEAFRPSSIDPGPPGGKSRWRPDLVPWNKGNLSMGENRLEKIDVGINRLCQQISAPLRSESMCLLKATS